MRGILTIAIVAASLWAMPLWAIDKDGEEDKPEFAFEAKELARVTANELETFSSEREFQRYIEKLDNIKLDSDADWAGYKPKSGQPILIAAAMQDAGADEEGCLDPQLCPEHGQEIVTTASKINAAPAATATTITNVQSIGVDEGDIVKQIGDYLLVLQDGRIFAINIKTMKVTDRKDVYRALPPGTKKKWYWESDFEGADWYDEMLVRDQHILIAAYDYEQRASELSIFALDQKSGKIMRRGVFLISSDDYYSATNYATRIVGDRLVFYTPYSLEQIEDQKDRPVIRRWVPQALRNNEAAKDSKPLLNPRSIYKPVLRTADPTVHSVSICPLGDYEETKALDCKTTAFIGPSAAQMFVSPNHVYLWNTPVDDTWSANRKECHPDWDYDTPYPAMPRAKRRDVLPGAVYRLGIRSGKVGVIGVNGVPFDQFSMEERNGRFMALTDWRTFRCEGADYAPADVSFLSVPETEFGEAFAPVANYNFTEVPAPGKRYVENRFAGDWLVYGGRAERRATPPDAEDGPQDVMAVAVPVRNPGKARQIALPHNIIRAERVGDDIMLNGYRDQAGLNMTLIGLGKKDAAVRSSILLAKRYESEGRSHAFNSMVDDDGSGLVGVPTVTGDNEGGYWSWRSDASDISFATKDADGRLADAGALMALPKEKIEPKEGYSCDVSCIDWYGNSRPIFTGGRIFGLMGTELVEAKLQDGKIRETARLDLTEPVPGVVPTPRRPPMPDDPKPPEIDPDEIWLWEYSRAD